MRLELWAVDRTKGAVLWKRPIAGGNHIERKQNMSSPSPVTDGKMVWVMTGVGMLKAFDFAGKELWARDIQTDYGRFGLNWGYASSPLLHGDALYVQVLHGMKTDDPSYVLKIDKLTGKTLWKVERPTDARQESPDAYTTPLARADEGADRDRDQRRRRRDGARPGDRQGTVARERPQSAEPRRLPDRGVAADGPRLDRRRRAATTRSPRSVQAAAATSRASHVAWSFERGPDVPTPVSDGTYLYVVVESGVVFCLDAKTGAIVYGPERLPNDFYSASPVLADGKIYVTGETQGITQVFRAGPKFELLASNTLGDPCTPYCLSSVAVSEGQLFIRLSTAMWVIGDRKEMRH